MLMPNGKPELCDSWNRLGKLVSRKGAIIGPRVVVRSVLVQEARTRILGSARMSQITTSQCGGSSKPLSMFQQTSLIISRHPVILGGCLVGLKFDFLLWAYKP
jgi:hypothetical protein